MKIKRCPPNCPDRSYDPNCHNDCEIYNEAQKERKRVKEEHKKDVDFATFKVDTVRKTKARVNR